MKTLNKITFRLKIGLLLFVTTITSCQDVVTYNDNYDDGMTSYGSPEITGVYSPDDTDMQTPLTMAGFNEMIVLVGENLSGVRKITFNDLEIELSELYATSEKACFPLPNDMPDKITNKLYYETELGNTTIDFKLDIPKLEVKGLYNEFALPGTSVQIRGKYFELYGFGKNESSVIKIGDTQLNIESISDEVVTIEIPADASDNSIIVLEWIGTEGLSSYKLPYRQTSSIIWDLSDPVSCGLWAGKDYLTDGSNTGDPTALFGSYFRVKGTFASWSYNSLPCGNFVMADEIFANPSDYLFKFEVNSATNYPFYDMANDKGGYRIKINGGDYQWKFLADEIPNTYGEWCTISIELTDLATKGLISGKTNLYWAMQPDKAWNVDHSFSNIRIEKKIEQ